MGELSARRGHPIVALTLIALALVLAVASAGCGPEIIDVGDAPRAVGATYVQTADDDGVRRVRRIDGNVASEIPVELEERTKQHVVITGMSGGSEQSSLVLFSEHGERLTSFRIPQHSPFRRADDTRVGGSLTQPQFLSGGTAQLVVLPGSQRRFLVLATLGPLYPSELVVLEALDRSTLVPKVQFWHPGHISRVSVAGPLLALVASDNDRQHDRPAKGYEQSLAIFDLSRLPTGSAASVTTSVPARGTTAPLPGPELLLYVKLPSVDPSAYGITSLEWQDGVVEAELIAGLTWRIHPAERRIELVPTRAEATEPRDPRQPWRHDAKLRESIRQSVEALDHTWAPVELNCY